MKTDKEMAEAIVRELQTRKKQQTRRRAGWAAALAVVLLLSGVVAAQQIGLFPPRAGGETPAPDVGSDMFGGPETSGVTAPATAPAIQSQSAVLPATDPRGQETTTAAPPSPTTNDNVVVATTDSLVTTTANCTTEPGGDASALYSSTQGASQPDKSGDGSFGIGGPMIPALPADRTIRETGEAITDEEAAAHFRENTWLQSALTSSGVNADGIRFAEHGYCHVSYDGTQGKSFEVRRNFRDYPVWNGSGELIAIVTLTKENGALSATPAFGGPWFGDYNAFLRQHRGEALVFVYAGWIELVITPDNKVVNPQGTDVSRYLAGVENPYEIFKCDAATYVP